jgi:phosphonate transport system substrate-binding protein
MKVLARIIGVGVLVLIFSACASTENLPALRLSDLDPEPITTRGATTALETIRLAIAPVYSPRQNLALYSELAKYLSEKLGRPVELVQSKTYAEINTLVQTGAVSLALVCSNAYLEGQAQFGMEALVVPQVNGATVYYAYLIVPEDSTAQTLNDLRGKTFAFSDPLSNTGRLVAVDELLQMHAKPETFFERTIYTYSHDNSIKAVAEHLADGATVDSQVFDNLAAAKSPLIARTRIIARYGPYGSSPFVVNPQLDSALKTKLRTILLTMDQDETGRVVLNKIGIERFRIPDDHAYDSVRAMRARAGRAQ